MPTNPHPDFGPPPAPATPLDPVRPPDWRWRWAINAAGGLISRFATPVPDEWQVLAVDFIRRQAKCDHAQDPATANLKLAGWMPGVYAARRLATCGDRATRELVEAYLLTGAPGWRAGEKCGLSRETGHCYAHLFFAVGDRLDCPGFIRNRVLGPKPRGPAEAEEWYLWKLAGWTKGEAFLDALVRKDSVGKHAKEAADVGRARDELMRDLTGFGSLAGLQAADPTHDAAVLLTAHFKLEEQAREAVANSGSVAAQQALSIAQTIGLANRYGGPAVPPEGLSAVEPRAAEVLAKAMDMPSPFPDTAGIDWKYPEGDGT